MQIVTSAVRGFCALLVSCVLYEVPVEQGLGVEWVGLADFSGFICKVEHPSEAENE